MYEVLQRQRSVSTDGMVADNNPLLTLPTKTKAFSGNRMAPKMADAKPRRMTLVQMVLLNSVVCGVEICACAGFTYIPPMLLKAGYTEENMSIILGVGPLMGFFIVPLIGRASDRCRSNFGRRRPFILVISVVLILSLIVIPYGDIFCEYFLGKGPTSKSFMLFLLTIGVILLDFTSQACLTPCEALLSDASKDTGQYERVFIVYSLMVSIGGFLGYLITAIDWNNTLIGSYFKTQERTVFTILMALFFVLLSATIMVANEKPLLRLEEVNTNHQMASTDTLLSIGNGNIESGYDTSGSESTHGSSQPGIKRDGSNLHNGGVSSLTKFPTIGRFFINCKLLKQLTNLLHILWLNLFDKLPEPVQKLFDIPVVLRPLALAHFCSWTAIMGFNLFFTDYMGNAVYEGNPNAPEDSYLRNRFDEGVRMGSWGLLLHCITSAVYALFVERLVGLYGCKLTYTLGMASFSMAMLGMACFKNILFVNTMAAFTGFGYATVTTIPFILVSKYHNEKETYLFDVVAAGGPSRGIATDMATLDSAYFLSQVILSYIMGYIVYMTGSVLSYMITAGVMGIVSCYFIQNVITGKQEIVLYRQTHTLIL